MNGQVRIEVKDEIRLVDAEDVAEDVIGAEIVDAAGGVVEVALVIAIERVVEGRAAGQSAGKRRGRRGRWYSLGRQAEVFLERAVPRMPTPGRRRLRARAAEGTTGDRIC